MNSVLYSHTHTFLSMEVSAFQRRANCLVTSCLLGSPCPCRIRLSSTVVRCSWQNWKKGLAGRLGALGSAGALGALRLGAAPTALRETDAWVTYKAHCWCHKLLFLKLRGPQSTFFFISTVYHQFSIQFLKFAAIKVLRPTTNYRTGFVKSS